MPLYISPPPRNPLSAALAAIVGGLLLAAAFFLGFIVILVVAAIGLIIGLVIFIRIKWFERKLRKQGLDPADAFKRSQAGAGRQDTAIEGEYTVVSKDSDD